MNSIEKIEQFANDNYVPIARKQTIEFIINLSNFNDSSIVFPETVEHGIYLNLVG